MCGIAGVIAWDDRYRVDRATLARMSARIAHRGPDGEGFYLNHEQEVTPDRPQCGFAFRRLAILDPDPRAMQPFTIGEKTIVFNGEIYNFRDLRAELAKLRPDYQWRTTGDTEVLLLAYDQWSEKCLDRLNGMFAFAVWDGREKNLFLARDRMGQKPLYVALNPALHNLNVLPTRVVAFASEVQALTELGWLECEVDERQLHQYLAWGYVPDGRSIYRNVIRLQPGVWLRVKSGEGARDAYFTVDSSEDLGRDKVARTRQLVDAAVARQMVSDVPLGGFLSGGVDSSVVVAAMRSAAIGARPVHTFTVRFDDPRYDEGHYAAAVAKHLGTDHHEFLVRPDAGADLPKLAATFGEPFGDSSALPTHYLAREARRHVTVALSGDGGDELFGGYDRYRAMAIGHRLRRVPRHVWQLADVAARGVPGTHPKSLGTRLRRLTATLGTSPETRYAGYLRVFDPATLAEIAPDQILDGPKLNFWDGVQFPWRIRDPVRAAVASDRLTYLPGDLLTKVDRASMLHGLEVRSPFMDHELVRFAAGLTTDQLLKGGPKRMLREAFADDLPAWVFKRKKMGFSVPIGDWFRGELRPMLRDNLFASDSFGRQHFNMKVVERLVEEHETQRVDHSQRLYALLMLELWWRTTR